MQSLVSIFNSRAVLSLVLSFLLAIPPHAAAADWNPLSESDLAKAAEYLTPEEQEALHKINQRLKDLQAAFANPAGPGAELDYYDLIQQTVVDKRREKIDAKVKSIEEADFAIRRQEEVSFLLDEASKNPARTIEFIGRDRVQIAADILKLDPRQDLIKIIETAYANDVIADTLDIKPEEIEHFVDTDLPPRRLYRMNLKVNVMKVDKDAEGKPDEGIAAILDQKDAQGSTAASFNGKLFYQAPTEGTYRFDITTSKGEVIHSFSRPVAAVGFYGRYLIYIDRQDVNNQTSRFDVKFIDLDHFKGAIGNTALAAYRLPVFEPSFKSIDNRDGAVMINGKLFEYPVFNHIADVTEVMNNIDVALMDPKTTHSASNLIKEIAYYNDVALQTMDDVETEMINSAMGGSQSLKEVIDGMEIRLNARDGIGHTSEAQAIPKKLREAFADKEDLLMTFNPTLKVIEDEVMSRERLNMVNRSTMVSRQFVSRLNLLMAKLNHPQPMGAPKIIQGLIMMSESALSGQWDKVGQNWKDLKQHPVISYGRWGAAGLAAAAVGASLSDSFALSLYETAQMGKQGVIDYIHHTDYGRNFVRLMGHASSTAVKGFPGTLNYFTAENLPRLGVLTGAMAGLVLSVYGSLHLVSNTISTARYFARHQNWIKRAKEKGSSTLTAYKDAFIKYQNGLKLYYQKGLSQAEAAASKGKAATKFNAAQEEVVDELLADLQKSSWFGRGKKNALAESEKTEQALLDADKAVDELSRSLEQAGDTAVDFENSLKKNKHLNSITTFRSAIGQFLLSYPSLLVTSRTGGGLWNYWFMVRSFALQPKSWPMFLTYPELFRVGIDGQKDRLHMPSELDGGYRSHWANLKFTIKHWNTDTSLADLKVVEKAVLPIEAIAYEVALEKSLEALTREVKDPKQLKEFFDSTALPKAGLGAAAVMEGASPSTGIRSIGDSKIARLSKHNQTFFRAVFDRLYAKTTETYLRKYMEEKRPDLVLPESTQDLKEAAMSMTGELNALAASVSGPAGKNINKEMKKIANDLLADGKIVAQSRTVATSMGKTVERFLLNAEHEVVQKLDPKKPQIGRFRLAEKQLGNVKAVVRAMNSLATEIGIEKLVGLLTILVMYSAVPDGQMKPLHDVMFGPDSWFYGSRYLFLNGFASGLIMSALASVWMKVQTDARIDHSGGFDKVPTVVDRDKSYFRYYLKSFLINPANKWSANQIYNAKLIWANLSAAFITIAVTNFLTMGRFDLGAFMAGYFIIFLTPLSGIDLKIDQTHELASRWQSAKVMRKLRAHPKMQDWITKSVLKKRYPHTMFSSAYGFFMGPFVSLYELMNTKEFGKRSFLNLLFNGYQPEEIVSSVLQKINKAAAWIPGAEPIVKSITTACEALLTTNNTALDPSKLIRPPIMSDPD